MWLFPVVVLLLASSDLSAQPVGETGDNTLLMALLAVVLLIAFFVIIQVSDNLLRIEAGKIGGEGTRQVSLFPGFRDLFRPRLPAWVDGPAYILSKGFDIKLEGAARPGVDEAAKALTFAIQPVDFRGLSPIPKLLVSEGDVVKAGDPLFFDKNHEAVRYAAPVSGEVIAIRRGERRAIQEVVILADKEQQYRTLPTLDPATAGRDELVAFLLDAGVWPMLRQRPFDVMADPQRIPDDIFVSTFDTAPLAPDLNFVVQGNESAFQQGLDVLGRLTAGQVHLGLDAGAANPPADAFRRATGVRRHWFKGAHPAGNVGVQIHHVAPLGPGRCVWTMGVQAVITLGKLFTEQRFHAERLVALTGSELSTPTYVRTFVGANIGDLLKDRLPENGNLRIVSGDVLSGRKQSETGFLGYHDDQLTVLREGNEYQLFGWLLPDLSSPSASRALPGWVFPDSTYRADTNTKGETRAFVVTGQYEEVLPMDIYPQHLMKAILTNNYDRMEGLGIYELIEEDVALCEFVCTSKQPLQKILRQGLDMVNEQG